MRRRPPYALLLLSLSLAACADGTGPVAQHIVITGRSQLRVGETVQFRATAVGAAGDTLRGLTIGWRSDDADVATVDDDGLVHTLATGTVTITAEAAGAAGVILVGVTPRPVGSLLLAPVADTIELGDTVQLRAVVRDTAADELTDRPVTWSVSDSTKARILADGRLIGRGPGGVAVRAAVEGKESGAFMTVLAPPVSLELPSAYTMRRTEFALVPVRLRTATGGVTRRRSVTWASANSNVASVDGFGLLRALSPGQTGIIARCCGSLADTMMLTVLTLPPRGMTLTQPDDAYVGEGFDLTASITDSTGEPAVGRAVWWSSDSTVLLVTPYADSAAAVHLARVLPLAPRTAQIGVRVDNVVRIRTTTVQPRPRGFHLEVQPDTVQVARGDSIVIAGSVRDELHGDYYLPVSFDWTVADSSVAVPQQHLPGLIEVHGLATGTTKALARVTWNGQEYTDSLVIVVGTRGQNVRILLNSPIRSLDDNRETRFVVAVRDSLGDPLATGVDVSVSVEDTLIAATAARMLTGVRDTASFSVRGLRAGRTAVVVRTGSAVAVGVLAVQHLSLRSIEIVMPGLVEVGDSMPLTAIQLDYASGQQEYPVQWTSATPAIASIEAGGFLVARAPGRSLISAQADGVRDTVTLSVQTVSRPVVTSLSAPVLFRDSLVAIAGSGFDPVAANNFVDISGVPAAVEAATATELVVRVPPDTQCSGVRSGLLSVGNAAGVAMVPVSWAPFAYSGPAVNQRLTLRGGAEACANVYLAAGQYLVVTANERTSNDPATGTVPGGAAPSRFGRPSSPALQQRLLEESRRLAQRAGPPSPLLRAARSRPRRSVTDSVGSVVEFRVPVLVDPMFCANYTTVRATRLYRGTTIDIYADLAVPRSAGNLYAISQMGSEFDVRMYPVLVANFGDPLVMDSLLDRNGRMVMLITPRVNQYGLAGFVVSCDFYPESVAPSSNTGEIFYSMAPEQDAPPGFPGGASEYWRWQARAVLMHEAKHVAAFAQRLSRGAPLEEPWLEEGSAVLAEELWLRGVHGVAWRGDANYAQTIYCEVRATNDCPLGIVTAFVSLFDFAVANGARTPLGPVNNDDASYYGSAWWLLRWILDRYAVDESVLLRALTQDATVTGVANLEALTGLPFGELIANWTIASRLDELPFVPDAFRVPSWDASDVFAGLAADFPSDFGGAYPFARGAGSETLRPGSARRFVLTGPAIQEFRLGGKPGETLRVDIVRIY